MFEHCQKIGSKAIKKCPNCKQPCERLISGGLHAIVAHEPTTIGSLGEANFKKMGHYERDEKIPKKEEQKSVTGLTKNQINKINKMTPAQKKEFIFKGKI